MPVDVGNEIAPLIGAAEGEVVMVPNVTIGQATVLSSLEYAAPRDTIVMTELDFPSVRYVYERLAQRLSARIVVVPSEDGISIDLERLLSAIDERTRMVAVSHVLFRSAFIMDAPAICKRAHDVGALVSLDAFHSVGIMPVDVRSWGVDFLTGGVLKWLCGGPGGCFLYVASSLRDRLTPALTGWQAHARPFEFEPEMDYAPDAFRWLTGTPVIPALYAATEGPRIVRRAGIERIREKSARQTAKLIELADARGYRVTAPRDPEHRGGTVAFDVPHAQAVSDTLLANDILVDYRPNAGIRVAPHFYTTDAEIDRVVSMIDDILATGSWRAYAREPQTLKR
jgi:kynureninase